MRPRGGGDVGAQRGQCGAVVLDERGVRGAARQRFKAECAGAGEHVQRARTFQGIASAPRRMQQHIEQRLPHAIRGRARVAARWCDSVRPRHMPATMRIVVRRQEI